MFNRRKGHVLLMWALTGILVTGMFSGCSQKTENSTETTQQEQEEKENLQGHNEDPDSNMGLWGRAMGSVLISMNDGSPYYFGGYEASEANKEAAAAILESSWQITGREDLLKQINELLQTGSRKDFLREAKEMKQMSPKELKKAMKQLSGPLLIHFELVQKNWETWGKSGLVAWDMCRISHLVQWGYIAGYLTLEEAQAMIEPAAKRLQKHFTSWEEVITNWLDGYALYAAIDLEESGNDYENRMAVYQSLVEQQESKGILFDDSLFQVELVPISSVSYKTILKELQTEKKQNKKQKKENQSQQEEAGSEENIE